MTADQQLWWHVHKIVSKRDPDRHCLGVLVKRDQADATRLNARLLPIPWGYMLVVRMTDHLTCEG